MKVKKIAAQVKARGMLILYDHTDAEGVLSQWIGTGAAAGDDSAERAAEGGASTGDPGG